MKQFARFAGHFFKVMNMSQTAINPQKQITPEDERRENLYYMKLQCLHAVLVQRNTITEGESKMIARMINAGFDEIK